MSKSKYSSMSVKSIGLDGRAIRGLLPYIQIQIQIIKEYIDNLNNCNYNFDSVRIVIPTIMSCLKNLIAIKGGKDPQS